MNELMARQRLTSAEMRRAFATIETGHLLESQLVDAESLDLARRVVTRDLSPKDAARREMNETLQALVRARGGRPGRRAGFSALPNQNGETVTEPGDQARLRRLQDVRLSMASLHAEALAERDGRTFTTEETLALIRRRDLIIDSTPSLALDVLQPSPVALEHVQDHIDG